MLLSSLILALLPIQFQLPVASAAARPPPLKCLHSGTERQINEAFLKGGKGATVSLCPGSVHRLNESIAMTAGRQTLTTEGNPKGRERAMIIVQGENLASAILADCDTCSHATIQSLIVDGNRPQLLRIPKGGALIETGNGEGQSVKNCRLYEPRGWSALHFREGNRKQCRKGLVADNEIGPCGEEWDDEYDGDMTSKPLWGFPNADGVSVACAETIVERNTIFDTTDGAIVIFGSRGSEIRHNHIYSRTRVVLGGINLVDYDPFNGDFTDVSVHHNSLNALSAFLKVGIVAGPSSWSDDTETTVHGASITDNTLHGQHFGYGIVVSSAQKFQVLRNTVDDDSVFSGVDGPRCPRAPDNARPQAFLINKGSASGVFQDDFKNGEVQHIICINPPDVDGKAYKPWRLRDSPESIAAKEAEHPELVKTTFDTKLADAVVAYQMTLLKAVDGLNQRIESLDSGTAPASDSKGSNIDTDTNTDTKEHPSQVKTGNQVVDNLGQKVLEIESLEKSLGKQLDMMVHGINSMFERWNNTLQSNKPDLVYVYNAIQGLKSPPKSKSGSSTGQEYLHSRSRDTSTDGEEDEEMEVEGGLVDFLGVLSVGGILGFLGWNVLRRWRVGRVAKGSKLV